MLAMMITIKSPIPVVASHIACTTDFNDAGA